MGLFKRFKRFLGSSLRRATWLLLKGYAAAEFRLWGIEAINRILHQGDTFFAQKLLIRYGATIGPESDINCPLTIHNAVNAYSNLTIGKQCHLGKEVFLDLLDKITIEDQVTISMRVTILTHTDVGHSPLGEIVFPPQQLPVLIRKGAYIGAGATILQGVTIGECSVVGAGAVVMDDLLPHVMAVGIPAKIIKSLELVNTKG
jgi:acetyltransferase-like isoleucine patch superfamily enzyme